jgi:hypothetical protein
MRYPPDNDDERQKELKNYAAEPWMMDQLARNWSYINWGPHEDYQWIDNLSDPNSPRKVPTWAAFRKGFTIGQYPDAHDDRSGGEIVGWYFSLARERKECKACDGSGQNPETKRIEDGWYHGERWSENITQDECDALVEKGRLWDFVRIRTRGQLEFLVEDDELTREQADALWEGRDTKHDRVDEATGEVTSVLIPWRDSVPAEEVNEACRNKRGLLHDAINRWICVETRARRLGVYGNCDKCDGQGFIPIDLKGRLELVLWIVNPLTGQSYGFEVENIEEDELDAVHDFLGGMRDRLVSRLDVPEATTSKDVKGFCSDESMMWTQAGSCLERSSEGWSSETIFDSWEEFCWPTDMMEGDGDNNYKIPRDHPKWDEHYTGEPSWGLDDLNELVRVRFGFDPHGQKVERLYLWMILPRKGASKRVTINSIGEGDLPHIRRYVQGAVERARERLDPSAGE